MKASTHILLIEDNPSDVRLIQEYFRDAETGRYKLFHSDTFRGGREILASERIDLVLLDLYLPDSLGFESFDHVFTEYFAYPFIVLTGLKDEDMGVKAVKRGAQDFLNKNDLTSQVLTRAIRYAIERHQMLRRLEQAQKLAKMGNWEHDLGTGELYCSPQVYAIFEKGGDLEFQSFEDYVAAIFPEDQEAVREAFYRALEEEGSFKVDHRIQKADGSFTYLILQGQAESDQVNRLERLVGTIQDITERKEFDELIRKKELAEQTARLKQEFLANTSHEIRTPLNVILQLANLLIKDSTDPRQVEYLNLINNAGSTLLAVVNDILDLSKIEANKIDFTRNSFSLSNLVSSLVSLLGIKAQEEGLEMTVQIEPDLPELLLGDPVRLNQILINLVNNAIKFTREGKIEIHVQTKARRDNEVDVEFSVADTGIGIPEDKMSTIFESFKRIETDMSHRQSGTGLGLSIVKQLVKLQGGDIRVESELGKGSVFTFFLPFGISEKENAETGGSPVPEIDESLLKGKHILVVEDNLLNQLVTKRILEDWGIEVTVAGNGQEGLDFLRAQDFDLVLMDLQMPVMDGYEATRHIRKDTALSMRDVPIIALTANALSGMDDECLRAGMDDYLSKPFELSILFAKMVENLERKRGKKDVVGNGHHENSISHTTDAFPSETPHVDLSYLHDVSGGDDEMIRVIIQSFLESTPEILEKMDKSFSEAAYLELSRHAHKLKSTVATMGIKDLRPIIEQIEYIAKNPVNVAELPELLRKNREVLMCSMDELTVFA